MRAARLLRILLILQNRGRQTSAQLARELEGAPRTILRDVDAMTEAGLPIIVFQGNQGGIELGFEYRTRLTGLTQDEARALGLVLSAETPMLAARGLEAEAELARAKLIESLPDTTRHHVENMATSYTLAPPPPPDDPRIAALARAVERQQIARLHYASSSEQRIHPAQLRLSGSDWSLVDARGGTWIARADWGRVNISRRTFPRTDPP